MKFAKTVLLAAAALALSACARIETGEVGLRVDMSKQVQGTELQPGSFNQTLVGEVLVFPVRDISHSLNDKHPITAETVALDDFDISYVYSINPNSVSEIWTTRSRSLHSVSNGDIYLLNEYMANTVNNALFKAVRKHSALTINDKRAEIEQDIKNIVADELKSDKLDTSLNLTLVQVRNMLPPRSILESAAAVVRSQNELKVKQNEVEIAKKEAERMTALSQNSEKSIAYMDAQSRLNVSTAMLAGKVNSVVVPFDFKGFVNVK